MELNEPDAKYLVRAGYEQSELGLIPSDWDIQPLTELAEKVMVGIASAATHAYRDRGVTMFRNQNIKPGYLDDADVLYIAEEYELTFKNKRLKAGDLLTARTGYPGTTSLVPVVHEGAQSFTTLITRPKKTVINSEFLCCFINSEAGQRYFDSAQIGGGQKNVNAAAMKQLPVLVPKNIAEQKAIATALIDADTLIESLEQLLAKKRQIKQGAMQELLTGQRRLPGFSDDWPTLFLGDLGTFLKGSGITREQAQSGEIPCVRYGEIYTTHNDHIRTFESGISPTVAATATLLRQGDILFAGSGETKEDIGKCVAFLDDFEAYAGGDIVILRPRASDPQFLGYALNTGEVNRQKASRGQGDAVVHISAAALAQVSVRVPERAEQTAIATVFSDMDTEITALEARLSKARHLKQGMAQALLTGRIRLVPPQAAQAS
ncbi:MAG: restriction endonuclease subunit S [Hydrogenophaga sp.]|uniref:restriction endonuclease subunit S n=1 Tax=Hydrogenophaga sp. TaxID=1904254 RepID=UPI0040366333